jgi:hypothetical protein
MVTLKYIFLIISRSLLLRMRNVSDKSCTENQNTHFVSSNTFFENRAVYEIMWENTVQPDRLQTKIWRMRFACWINTATETHSEYEVLIAFRR